jgi:hypothetical protein
MPLRPWEAICEADDAFVGLNLGLIECFAQHALTFCCLATNPRIFLAGSVQCSR